MLSTAFLYSSVIIIVSLFTLLGNYSKEKFGRPLFISLSILIPSLLAGFRYRVGTDYDSYVLIFNDNFTRDNYEIGFEIFLSFFKSISENESFIFFSFTLLLMIILMMTIIPANKQLNAGMIMFVYLILFFFDSFNILRQSIALVLILYSLKFIWKFDFKRFFAIVLLASCFHTSALVILPAYLFNRLSFDKHFFTKLVFLFLIFFIILLNLDNITNLIARIYPSFTYYSRYFIKLPSYSLSLTLILRNLVPFISITFAFLLLKREGELNKKHTVLYCLFLASVVIAFSSDVYGSDVLRRLSDYFQISLVLIVPDAIKILARSKYWFLGYLLIGYYIFEFYFNYFYRGYGEIVPYQTIF